MWKLPGKGTPHRVFLDALKKQGTRSTTEADEMDSADELDIDEEATGTPEEAEDSDDLRMSEKGKRPTETRKEASRGHADPARANEFLRTTRSKKLRDQESPVKPEELQTDSEALLRELQREALGLRTKNKRLSVSDRDKRETLRREMLRRRERQKEEMEEQDEKDKQKKNDRDRAATNKQNEGKKKKKSEKKVATESKTKVDKNSKKGGKERKQVEKIKEQMFLEGRRVTRNMLKRGIQESTKKGKSRSRSSKSAAPARLVPFLSFPFLSFF